MLLFVNHSLEPAFNLALEEYILTKSNDDVVMLWRNSPSVILGRNQNAIEEIDVDFVRDHDITAIRRLSGGGAVFHDPGNINYSIIRTLEEGDFGNYGGFTAPICEFLQELGVDANFRGRNDLVIGDAKFSGNAQAVCKGRILHHGTILYDADLNRLSGALKPKKARVESTGIRSFSSEVTNVARHLPHPCGVEAFFEQLVGFYTQRTKGRYVLSPDDIEGTQRLVQEKYSTWEWNFGHSPAYGYHKITAFPTGAVDLRLSVDEGIISKAGIFGDFFSMREVSELQGLLAGVRHDKVSVREALRDIRVDQYIYGVTNEQFIGLV
jgi:lipoate-protein ligase A